MHKFWTLKTIKMKNPSFQTEVSQGTMASLRIQITTRGEVSFRLSLSSIGGMKLLESTMVNVRLTNQKSVHVRGGKEDGVVSVASIDWERSYDTQFILLKDGNKRTT